jgi:pimeloyl-ACP methyl ester carboxylesterase
VTVIAGDTDTTVSVDIHSRRFTRDVPQARLIVLPGVGHMPQNAAPELIAAEVAVMARAHAAPEGITSARNADARH